jgi:hypothetical protein
MIPLSSVHCIYLVDISLLETLEQEEVELTIFGGSLGDGLLDKVHKLLLGHIL